MSKRIAILALFLGLFIADWWAQAQDKAPANRDRIVYTVKQGSAKDLATLLGKHFPGEVEASPDPSGNLLLISAAPSAFDQVLKLLQQLDRPLQMVSIEVIVADVVQKKADGARAEPDEKGLDPRALTGSLPDVLAQVEALEKKGRLAGLKRIQLSGVEGLPVNVLIGENKPYTMGVSGGPGGRSTQSINYKNTGTTVKLVPRVTGDKTVQIDISVTDARMQTPETGVKLGTDDNGAAIRAPEFINTDLNTTLRIPSGQAVSATGIKNTSSSGQAQTLIIVGARIAEPAAGK